MGIAPETNATGGLQVVILLLHGVVGGLMGVVRIIAEEFSDDSGVAVLILIEIDSPGSVDFVDPKIRGAVYSHSWKDIMPQVPV
jgi:hypothetical protein